MEVVPGGYDHHAASNHYIDPDGHQLGHLAQCIFTGACGGVPDYRLPVLHPLFLLQATYALPVRFRMVYESQVG